MFVWPSAGELHRRYVQIAAWVAGVLGVAYGVAAVVRSSITLAGSALALFGLVGVAAWQLRRHSPRLDVLVGLGGFVLIAAAFVRDPPVLVAGLLAYAVFAAAAAYLGSRLLVLWFGFVILVAAFVTILRMNPPTEVALLAAIVLAVGNGVGGFWHMRTGMLLRSEVAKWDALFGSAPDGIVITDTSGRVLVVNDRFVEVFGLDSREEAAGGSLDRFIPDRYRRNHPKLIQDFVESSSQRILMSERPVLYGLRSDGTEFPIDVSIAKVRFDGQTVLQASIRDVTQQVEAAERLEEMHRSRIELLAAVSHEVRTPLTSVLGFAQLLQSSDDWAEGERETMIREIASQANDMADLIEDLLVGARAELGELEVVGVPVRLRAQVNQVLESLQADALVTSEGEVVALGDPGRIRQIVRNLVTNARRYGGPDIRVHLGRDGDHTIAAVSDDGPPLLLEELLSLFELFRIGEARRNMPGPVGIGLYLSRDLARKMGGDLTFERRGGRSVFELTLPAAFEQKGIGRGV